MAKSFNQQIMKSNKDFRFVVEAICKAQIASDAGKGIYELTCKKDKYAANTAYLSKENYILQALGVLTKSKIKNKYANINYWCEKTGDQNGRPSIIVYFDIKINDKRKQVSFHTPLNQASENLLKYVSTGRKTRWNKLIGSREVCRQLIKELNL